MIFFFLKNIFNLKKASEFSGKGKCIWREDKHNVWDFQGTMSKGRPNGIVTLESKEKKISFRGRFKDGQRTGKSIVNENGKEFYIYYEDGFEEKRERTFQGVRIMIIGFNYFFFKFLFHFLFFIFFFFNCFIFSFLIFNILIIRL